jgi:twitching motility protein PilT
MQLDQLLRLTADRGASDLHLKPMRPPLLRIHGKLMPIESDPLTPDQIQTMVESVLSPAQKAHLRDHLAVDIGHGVRGLARFRGSVFMQRGTLTATFRRIPIEVQELSELGLPDVLEEFSDLPMGLVLITGPTGSGKSTTLAALINRIARRRSAHVITIEDPIEFLFLDDVASISQPTSCSPPSIPTARPRASIAFSTVHPPINRNSCASSSSRCSRRWSR